MSDDEFNKALLSDAEHRDRILRAMSVFGNAEEGLSAKRKYALDKIKECYIKQTRSLDLNEYELGIVPEQIGILTHLEELDLSYNKLTELCPEIGKLKKLRKLNLDGNWLETLPSEFSNLESLLELNLGTENSINKLGRNRFAPWRGNSRLKSLPIEVCKLNSLKTLTLQLLTFKTLPDEIGQLKSLEHLDLGWSKVTSLPSTIGGLTNLRSIRLSSNIETIPPEIGKLVRLEKIDIAGRVWRNDKRALRELPAQIGDLSSLRELDVAGTQLTDLPSSLGKLKLKRLDVSWCLLKHLPSAIVDLTAIEELDLSYNSIRTIPFAFANLTTLKVLNVGYNPLRRLPPVLGRMKHLEYLMLPCCGIQTLPVSLGQFNDLKVLKLSGGSGHFRDPDQVPLRANEIRVLPDSLSKLESLKFLELDENPIDESALTILRPLTLRWLNLDETSIPAATALAFRQQMHAKRDNSQRRHIHKNGTPGINILDFGEHKPSKRLHELFQSGDFLDGKLVHAYINQKTGVPQLEQKVLSLERLSGVPDEKDFKEIANEFYHVRDGADWGVHPFRNRIGQIRILSRVVMAFNQYLPINKSGTTYICRDNTTGKNFVSTDPASRFEDATMLGFIQSKPGTEYIAVNKAYHFHRPEFSNSDGNVDNRPCRLTYKGLGLTPIEEISFFMEEENWKTWGTDRTRHLTRLRTDDSNSPTLFDFFAPKTTASDVCRNRVSQDLLIETPGGHLYFKGHVADAAETRANLEYGELVAVTRRKSKDKWKSSYFVQSVSELPRATRTTWKELRNMDRFTISFGKSFPLSSDKASHENAEFENAFTFSTNVESNANTLLLGSDNAAHTESIVVHMRTDRSPKSYFMGPYAYVFDEVEIESLSNGGGQQITLHGTSDLVRYNPIDRITIRLAKSSGDSISSAINLTRAKAKSENSPPLMHFFSDRNPKDEW